MSASLPRHCVIDASVLVKYITPEAETPFVRQMLRELLNDDNATIYVPDLLYIECANILLKRVRRGEVDSVIAEESISDLSALELDVTPMFELSARALHLACEQELSAYDASYLALAEHFGVPLITTDLRLIDSLSSTKYSVISLLALLPPSN